MMKRYFFHITVGGRLSLDNRGELHADSAAAIAVGQAVANEMAEDTDHEEVLVSVVNKRGDVVAELRSGQNCPTRIEEKIGVSSTSNKWKGDDDVDAHTISLSVEIDVKLPLIEECVAQTVRSLREVADRIERGEEIGKITDKRGREIGSFDCLPDETDEF